MKTIIGDLYKVTTNDYDVFYIIAHSMEDLLEGMRAKKAGRITALELVAGQTQITIKAIAESRAFEMPNTRVDVSMKAAQMLKNDYTRYKNWVLKNDGSAIADDLKPITSYNPDFIEKAFTVGIGWAEDDNIGTLVMKVVSNQFNRDPDSEKYCIFFTDLYSDLVLPIRS